MSKILSKAIKLKNVSELCTDTIYDSGYYITQLRQVIALTDNQNSKLKYQFELTKALEKHKQLISNKNKEIKKDTNKTINILKGSQLMDMANSILAVSNGKYSLIDMKTFKDINTLTKTVSLKDSLVLPINVKSANNQFLFRLQIVLSKDNILAYSNKTFDTKTTSISPNANIFRLGDGIKNNELMEKSIKINENR